MALVTIITYTDADFYRTFTWETGTTPINLSGGTMEMMLRRQASDQAAVLRLGTDTGEIVYTDAAAGAFTVRITQDALEQLGVGEFEHSLIFTLGEQKIRVWSGTLDNRAGATR